MSVQRVFSIDMSSAVRNIIINYGFYWYGIDMEDRNIFIIDIDSSIISSVDALIAKSDIIRYNRQNKLDELI
jgi:hypothetical protein